MGFLGTRAGSLADANLLLQISVIALLFLGGILAKRRVYRRHGLLMTGAVLLNALAILAVMGPSLVAGWGVILAAPLSTGAAVSLFHVAVGGAAEALGLYLVANWRLRAQVSPCMRLRRIMLLTLFLWLLAAASGVAFYIYYYIW